MMDLLIREAMVFLAAMKRMSRFLRSLRNQLRRRSGMVKTIWRWLVSRQKEETRAEICFEYLTPQELQKRE